MTEKGIVKCLPKEMIIKMECISCKYFHEYPNEEIHCFMKHNVYLINNKNVYPNLCEDYERGDLKND